LIIIYVDWEIFTMEKKIYVVGLEESIEEKINAAVSAVAGVASCVANTSKCQVLVNFDESVADIEAAIDLAITSCGVEVL
jgi:copper chaperone CopZ